SGGQIHPPYQTHMQETFKLAQPYQTDKVGLALLESGLALGDEADQLIYFLFLENGAGIAGRCLEQHQAHMLKIVVSRKQQRDRLEMRKNPIRLLLKLPHALEQPDGIRVILDFNTKQGSQRSVEHMRHPLEHLDLYDFALFHAIDDGSRHL